MMLTGLTEKIHTQFYDYPIPMVKERFIFLRVRQSRGQERTEIGVKGRKEKR